MNYNEDKDNKPKTRAKRKLTNIDFTGQDAAVALVSKDQGGPANSQVTLLLKNAASQVISEELNTEHKPEVITSVNKESTVVAPEVTAVDTSIMQHEDKKGVNPVVKQKQSKERLMKEKEVIATEQEIIVEMVEKSAFESLQKSLQDQQVQLQKALDQIKSYEAEKQEVIVKSKTAAITSVVKSAELQAPILKAALALQDETDFNAFVTAITNMVSQVEKSALFEEVGSSAEPEVKPEGNPVANLLKSKYAAK